MKKLRAMYKGYMLHPILYKTVTRTSIVAVLMLLWERYVSDGTFSMWEAPGFLCGVVLLIWAWVDYMRLDGLTIHHLLEEFKGIKPQKKFHATRSIMDYADEKIVSFEELEPEERTYCSMLSNLVLGLPLGVLLVAGDKDGVLPLPGWLMHILNIVINILRSVPFLILMICVFPLTRVIVGTTVGTKATIVPLVVAAFPFVARLVETSLRELDEGVVEAAQSMGATPFQIITKVMIPECLPGLISSMTTALTTILGYSAMSGVIGGGGLGKIALSYGYYRYQTNIMIVCVILLVLLVQVFQTAGTLWATRSDKRLRK